MSLLAWSEIAAGLGPCLPHTLTPSADGDWSYQLPDGRRGCSARQPRREAALRCDGLRSIHGTVILGVGAGHELDLLLERGADHVLVVEADPRALATTLERWRRLGHAWPARERCLVLLAETDESLCAGLAECLLTEHGERPVLARVSVADQWRPTVPRAAALIEDLLRLRVNARAQEERLADNAQRNRDRLLTSISVTSLQGIWQAAPVVVCGAGPGLESALPMLSNLQRQGTRLVAASTALPVLEAHGLCADAVVATDPSSLLAGDLPRTAVWADVPLAVFPGSCTELVLNWPGPLWLALPEGPGLRQEEWEGRRPGRLRAGCGTVAGPALALGAWLSAGPLWLCGVDLAMNGSGYAAGVRRPTEMPRPDFAFARRRMSDWVVELRRAGRQVRSLTGEVDWLPQEDLA